jgi:ABC-type transport system involved in multi-copper enzyme maturation permease subunit
MLFAGEFDRGTIKLLLTRPVTRTDLFLAKCATAVLVAGFYMALVVYVSLVFALARGELGAVWDGEAYATFASYETIMEHARTAVLLCILPTLTAAFLGIFVSNLTEHSGYAVAYGLIIYVVLDLAAASFLRSEYLFTYHTGYALEVLCAFSEGSSTMWRHQHDGSLTHIFAPLVTLLAFASAAYAVFRSRNVTA